MRLRAIPACDGIVLGGHGLFTWGDTPTRVLRRTASGPSIRWASSSASAAWQQAGRRSAASRLRQKSIAPSVAAELLPFLRGIVSSNRRVVAHWDGSVDALEFANSQWAEPLSALGTSCPDHFLRTRICPMFVPWDAVAESVSTLQQRIAERAASYREAYTAYYRAFADASSPRLRDSNPSVVVDSFTGRVRVREGQARSADHDRVLRQRDPRDGWSDGARGHRSRRDCVAAANGSSSAPTGTSQRVHQLSQLRGAATARGVPNRVLGARRSQVAALAAGARIQPAGHVGRGRWQRHWPRCRSRDGKAWRACDCRSLRDCAREGESRPPIRRRESVYCALGNRGFNTPFSRTVAPPK